MWFPFWCEYSSTEELNFKHWHFGIEFILVTEGSATFSVNESLYTVSAGQVFMIHRVANHQTVSVSPDFKKYCLLMQHDELGKIPIGMNMLTHLATVDIGSAYSFELGDDRDDVFRIFSLLATNWNKSNPYNMEYITSLATLLLAILCRHCEITETVPADERMFRIRDAIDHNFSSNISVAEIARQNFISEDHLIHEFKRVIGSSPGQYIIVSRLTYARELLTTTEDSLPVIAQRAGFGDVNNFIRSFKKAFGMPPGQFRRQLRQTSLGRII